MGNSESSLGPCSGNCYVEIYKDGVMVVYENGYTEIWRSVPSIGAFTDSISLDANKIIQCGENKRSYYDLCSDMGQEMSTMNTTVEVYSSERVVRLPDWFKNRMKLKGGLGWLSKTLAGIGIAAMINN